MIFDRYTYAMIYLQVVVAAAVEGEVVVAAAVVEASGSTQASALAPTRRCPLTTRST